MMRASAFCMILSLATSAVTAASQDDLHLTKAGKPLAMVYAPGENQWAGERLVDRLQHLTGVRLRFRASGFLPEEAAAVIAVGTPSSNPIVRVVAGNDPRFGSLGEEGYLLTIGSWNGKPVIVAGGSTLPGVNHAVSELVAWRLRLDGADAWVPGGLDVTDRPAFKYRLLWNWTMGTHWHDTVDGIHEPDPQNANNSPAYDQAAVGFLRHHERAIDFFSDHKLNGLIVWHLLNDHLGGIETAQEIMRYGKRRNVRILPGIGTVIYNGFYSSGKSPYSLPEFLKEHPDVRKAAGADGKELALPCSLDPAYQQWLRQGTRWFFETFPDVGGANVEHGDFHACHCELCRAEKAKPENDPNCFWDMMNSERPIFEIAREMRPDAWMIFATYSGFTPDAMNRSLKTAHYPPRFLGQYPSNAVCQWTLTDLIDPASWPERVAPPTGGISEHIGYFHQGGLRACCPGHPVNRDCWWAGPSAIGDEISEVIQFLCSRAHATGMAGIAMYGEIGAALPAAELRYLAMEYFTWHPERNMEDFIVDRLSICYGSEELARRYLAILRDVTRDADQIEQSRRQAEAMTQDHELDVRQRERWQNLRDEMARRLRVLSQPAGKTTEKPR